MKTLNPSILFPLALLPKKSQTLYGNNLIQGDDLKSLQFILILLSLSIAGCFQKGYFNPTPEPDIIVHKPEISPQQATQECWVIAKSSALKNDISQNLIYLGFLENALYGECMNTNESALDLWYSRNPHPTQVAPQ